MLNKWPIINLSLGAIFATVGLAIRSCNMSEVENIFGATWCVQGIEAASGNSLFTNNVLHCGGCYMASFGALIAGVSVLQLMLVVLKNRKNTNQISILTCQ